MDQGSTPVHNIGAVEQAPATTPIAVGVAPVLGAQRRSFGVRFRDYGGSFLFAVHYLFFFGAFLLWPLIYALWVSLRNWTTTGGDSPPPATSVPSYMGVVVAGSATKSGSPISGNSVHIVVVKVDPSYAPNPMSHGTGTIVATFC